MSEQKNKSKLIKKECNNCKKKFFTYKDYNHCCYCRYLKEGELTENRNIIMKKYYEKNPEKFLKKREKQRLNKNCELCNIEFSTNQTTNFERCKKCRNKRN